MCAQSRAGRCARSLGDAEEPQLTRLGTEGSAMRCVDVTPRAWGGHVTGVEGGELGVVREPLEAAGRERGVLFVEAASALGACDDDCRCDAAQAGGQTDCGACDGCYG